MNAGHRIRRYENCAARRRVTSAIHAPPLQRRCAHVVEAIGRSAIALVDIDDFLHRHDAGEAVCLKPAITRHGCGNHLSTITGTAHIGNAPTVERNLRVGSAIEQQDWHRLDRPGGARSGSRIQREATARTGNRGDEVRSGERKSLSHHRAVRAAGHEYPRVGKVVLAADELNQRREKTDVVGATGEQVVGTAIGPGRASVFRWQTARVDNDETLSIGHCAKDRQRVSAGVRDAKPLATAAV